MLPCLYFMNKIDFTDEQNLFRLRMVFGVVHGLLFAIIGFIYWRIHSNNDQREIQVPAVTASGAADPSKPPTVTTVKRYDLEQLRKLLTQLAMGTGISGLIHWKFGVTPPLFIQSVMNPYQNSQNPLVKYYLLGDRSPEIAQRPWKADQPQNPLMSLFGGGGANATEESSTRQTQQLTPSATSAVDSTSTSTTASGEKKHKKEKHSSHSEAANAEKRSHQKQQGNQTAEEEVSSRPRAAATHPAPPKVRELTPDEAEQEEARLKVITPQLLEEERREHQKVESGEEVEVPVPPHANTSSVNSQAAASTSTPSNANSSPVVSTGPKVEQRKKKPPRVDD